MTQLKPIGLVENLDELDLSPFEQPVFGYTMEKEPVEFVILFRRTAIQQIMFDMMSQSTTVPAHVGDDGKMVAEKTTVPTQLAMQFLDDHIVNAEEWHDWLRRPEVYIHTDTIGAVAIALASVYLPDDVPISQLPDLQGGPEVPSGTTRAAADFLASTTEASVSASA
jgi:hypothetical protein